MRFPYKSILKDGEINCVHEEPGIPTVQRIVRDFQPKLIIELGTSWGGFTLVLHESSPKAELHSYDKPNPRRTVERSDLFTDQVHFHNEDLLEKPLITLVKLCRDPRKKLLYCDNGNKIKEVQYYAKHLRSGDMLGVHDWDREIAYDDIKDILTDFEPIEHDTFKSNNWSSRFWRRE